MRSLFWKFSLAALAMALSGCVTYLTPGAGAPMQLAAGDAGGAQRNPPPAAPFPARIAVVHLQASGYRSFGAEGVAAGDYSIVMTREVETANDFDAMGQWPQVLDVEPLSRLLLPASIHSFDDLRAAAVNADADVLFVYTFDTHFHIENQTYAPEQLITLGVLPGREAAVTSTADGVFIDARSGYRYGAAEGSSNVRTLMTKWTKPSAADDTRLQAEREAFKAMMQDAHRQWDALVARNAATTLLPLEPDGDSSGGAALPDSAAGGTGTAGGSGPAAAIGIP